MFHVREERKASVMRAFMQMRAEGREVRRVGAIALLTAPQVTKQIALRVFLDKVQVERRTGKKEEMVAVLTGLVQREVAARAHMTGDGKEEITSDSETTRLRELGFGKKKKKKRTAQEAPTGAQRPARDPPAPRQPRVQRAPRALRRDRDGDDLWLSSLEVSNSDDEADSEPEDTDADGIDLDEIMQQDDVFEVEKIEKMREENGMREFLVKWKGWAAKDSTWEPEANVSEFNSKMVATFLKRQEAAATKAAAANAAAPAAAANTQLPTRDPTRARSSRAGVDLAAQRARAAQLGESDDDLESPSEDEATAAPVPASKKRRAPAAAAAGKAPARAGKAPARAARGQGNRGRAVRGRPVRKVLPPDSSDEERARLAQDSADEE